MLDLYVSKIPSTVRAQDVSYLRSKPVSVEDDSVWYSSQGLGKTKSHFTANEDDIQWGWGSEEIYKTTAFAPLEQLQSSIPENVIMEGRRGYRSSDGGW